MEVHLDSALDRRFSQILDLKEACSLCMEAHLDSALCRQFSQSLVLRSMFFMHGGQCDGQAI